MNYLFQTSGLVGTRAVNYSDFDLPDLDEQSLSEAAGIDPNRVTAGTGLGTLIVNRNQLPNIAGVSIDFNNSGNIDTNTVSVDLNEDGQITTLNGKKDWDHIVFAGGAIGIGENASGVANETDAIKVLINSERMENDPELTLDEALEHEVVSEVRTGALMPIGPFTVVKDLTGQKVYVRVFNMSNKDTVFSLSIEKGRLNEKIDRKMSVPAYGNKLNYLDMEIPINASVPNGDYTINVVLKSPGREDVFAEIPVQIHTPSEREVEDLMKVFNGEDESAGLEELPDVVKENYKTVLDNYISDKSITPIIKLSRSTVTYNGKVQQPAVTVKDGGTTLKANIDYDVTYTGNCKNVGTYKVTVNLKGKYKGSHTLSYKIVKAKNTFSTKGKTAKIKYNKLKKKKQTITRVKAFKINKAVGKVTFKKVSGNNKIKISKAGKITVKKGLKKGTYKIKVKVTAAGNKNYKKLTKTVTVKVKIN